MKKAVQYFSKKSVEQSSKMTPDQVLEFLENYKNLVCKKPEKCQLISMKIEPSLLKAFKQKAELEGFHYQTKIKELMREWVSP